MVAVSVVIPVYNAERFLAETLDSVLCQSYGDFEVVLVDDGSTDASPAIACRYQQRYPDKVRLVRKRNGGPASARNLGIAQARGEFVAFLDADDLWLPQKLAKQVACLRAQPAEVGLVYTRAVKFDAEGVWLLPRAYQRPAPSGWVYRDILRCNPVPSPSVLVRRACFARVGGFDESLDIIEDQDMWARLARVFRVALVDEVLCLYREHAGGRSKREEVTLRREVGVIEKHRRAAQQAKDAELVAFLTALLAERLYDLGWHYLRHGQRRAARAVLAESLRQCCSLRVWRAYVGSFLPYPLLVAGNRLYKALRPPPPIAKSPAALQRFLDEIAAAKQGPPRRGTPVRSRHAPHADSALPPLGGRGHRPARRRPRGAAVLPARARFYRPAGLLAAPRVPGAGRARPPPRGRRRWRRPHL
ncbi:MAG: hypothetical protein KatS3mg131_3784 [Candidatus Tectimicrobiota bacterium]|nr:MAG: hypothetical protein KatS3mg131_3784 [Candidatus Tectomicrobia bacterium]